MKNNNKLAAYRKLYNIKQADIAKLLNISSTTYSFKESGKQEFRLSEAKFLSNFFNVSIDELFFEDGVNNKMTKIV